MNVAMATNMDELDKFYFASSDDLDVGVVNLRGALPLGDGGKSPAMYVGMYESLATDPLVSSECTKWEDWSNELALERSGPSYGSCVWTVSFPNGLCLAVLDGKNAHAVGHPLDLSVETLSKDVCKLRVTFSNVLPWFLWEKSGEWHPNDVLYRP